MKFEQNPTQGFKHGIVFESSEREVEAVAAMYRERLDHLVHIGRYNDIQQHERDFSTWPNSPNRTMLVNFPLGIATLLDEFHDRTEASVIRIQTHAWEPAFDSDAIARRMLLGQKAFELAGKIRLEFDVDTLHQMLEDHGSDLFAELKPAPQIPPGN